jgi:hypothetical protein
MNTLPPQEHLPPLLLVVLDVLLALLGFVFVVRAGLRHLIRKFAQPLQH